MSRFGAPVLPQADPFPTPDDFVLPLWHDVGKTSTIPREVHPTRPDSQCCSRGSTVKTPLVMFVLLVSMAVILAVAAWSWTRAEPKPDGLHTEAKIERRPMDEPMTYRLGSVFGGLIIAFFVAVTALGFGRRAGGGIVPWLLVGLVGYWIVFAALMWLYSQYVRDPAAQPIWGFPASTAVMIFGLWPFPAYFVLLCVIGFRRWVYRPEDEERFRDIVRRYKDSPPR